MTATTPNPDGRIYLAIANNNGWATANDPITACTKAVVMGGMWDEDTVASVYHVVHDTWDVSFMGGVMCKDITKGVPLPVGFYRVGLLDNDEVDYDDNDEPIYPTPMITAVVGTTADLFWKQEWEAFEATTRRAAKLITERQ